MQSGKQESESGKVALTQSLTHRSLFSESHGHLPHLPQLHLIPTSSCSAITRAAMDLKGLPLNSPRFPVKFLYGDLIIVYVGAGGEEFRIHYDLLQANSNLFKTTVVEKSPDQDRTIELPDYNPDVFRYYVHWLYHKSLDGYHNYGLDTAGLERLRLARVFAVGIWNDEDSGEKYLNANIARAAEGKNLVRSFPLVQLVGLYILAAQLQVPGLEDQIITKIIQVYGKNKNARTYYWGQNSKPIGAKDADAVMAINLAYNNLGDCFLKQLLVQLYIDNVREDYKYIRVEYDAEFLSDVIGQLRRRQGNPNLQVPSLKVCEWHEHDGGYCSAPDTADGDEDQDECVGEIPDLSSSWLRSPSNSKSFGSTSIQNSPAHD